MPVPISYPGVYIEEIPSGVRTITGVATSITAFIGRAKRGPVNDATIINNFADYERNFGGLDINSSMSFSVRDFFLNGGAQAVVVRLYHADPSRTSSSTFVVGAVMLTAAHEGSWGAYLRAEVDLNVSEEVATGLGLVKSDLFNLTVRDIGSGGVIENFLNLSFKDSARRVDRVLAAQSKLVRWDGLYVAPAGPPVAGKDPVTEAELELKAAKEADPPDAAAIAAAEAALQAAVDSMSASNGIALTKTNDFTPINAERDKKGLYALEQTELFNILCIPPYKSTGGEPNLDIDVSLVADAAVYCERRRAMLLVDSPSNWDSKTTAVDEFTHPSTEYIGTRSKNAALFFPRIEKPNPLRDGQIEAFAPSGTIAGLFSRTDSQRGVWKAPAGIEATLRGVQSLSVILTDDENGELNPLGVNCLRSFPVIGRIAWGARTLRGADQMASEWKYIPVRRTALFIEESLYRGTQWVVFEPNDEPLWAQIRLNVGAFMNNLFRQGAFQGTTPRQAYFVKCDKETTTQNDIDRGIVNIVVGFAPLKPAEFVIVKLQQIAGELEV
ncbi:MAG: phage tail sheath family protein [Gammaproteobacteria bacterium]|nr:phage tail sheath family protein [Gammaproteobacteria bacterium]